MTDLYRLLPEELDALVSGLSQPGYRADQILRALYHGTVTSIDDLKQLPAGLRSALAEGGWAIGSARERAQAASSDGETTKLLLELRDGKLVETVLMQYPEPGRHPRSTVCVSTQAGCAMGCVFCATGQMGFERNLQAEEIVAQVIHFDRILRLRGEHVTNIVYMGMGEPLANYAETIRSIRVLAHPRAFAIGQRSITVSTVGVVRGIERLAGEGLQVNLAISLHAPNDELRRRLVPTASPGSVGALLEAGRRYFRETGRRVTYEYALLEGINDSVELAQELSRKLKGTGSHVNLIPVNPTAGGFTRPARARVLAFERVLQSAGIGCTVRVQKGVEIAAACGQLRTDFATGSEPGTGPAEQVDPPARSAGVPEGGYSSK